MHIGTIGAAAVAQAVAHHAVRTGHSVTLSNRRGPDSLAEIIDRLGANARAGTREEAASAELVLLASPWIAVRDALADLPAWNGRILMDATNHFASCAPDYRRDALAGRTSSEIVAELAPGAHVVKVFNTLVARQIAASPAEASGRRVLFLSGDNDRTKQVIAELVTSFGFAPLDLGRLKDGGRLQQLDGPLAGPNLVRMG